MGKREPEMMRPDKIEPYFFCPAFWSFLEGNLCLVTRKDCENHRRNCPKLKEYILSPFFKIEKL